MAAEQCYELVCFIPLDASGQKFFGFAEFLSGLALMILAWTIAEVRYKFRISAAPLPLQGVTFVVVAVVGILTLLTDLWRAEQWLVPKGHLLTPASWQALLGATFFLTFLIWTWFAFIRPATYGRHNAERYARTLYRFVLKGSSSELAVIADELAYSVGSIVRHASDKATRTRYKNQGDEKNRPPKVEVYANELLLLIADKRLCRAVVDSSPGTALAIFREIGVTKKYDIQVQIFAKNIVNEAIANTDSFLFHETEGYESGLIGYYKPLSQAMFSNYQMVETIGTMLDPDYSGSSKWDATQWKAYCRVVLITFRSYVKAGCVEHSYALYQAMGNIKAIATEVGKLNGLANFTQNSNPLACLDVAVDFIGDAVDILNEKAVPDGLTLRIRKENGHDRETFYDHLAHMIFAVVCAASNVTSPRSECWWVQYSAVWGVFFSPGKLNNLAGRVVQFKARRLIYNEILKMKNFQNFVGARIIGLCLNVMGFTVRTDDFNKGSRALQKAVLSWTKKYFVWLQSINPRLAEGCLVEGMSYDPENRRIVKTVPAEGLRREVQHYYFQLDPAPPDGGTTTK